MEDVDANKIVVNVKNKIPLKYIDNSLEQLSKIDEYLSELQLFEKKNKNINLFLRRKTSLLQMTSDYLSE